MTDTSDIWNEELFVAIEHGRMTIVRRMLAVQVHDHAGSSRLPLPLHMAIQLGRLDIVEKLIDSGGDVNEQSEIHTPLWLALQKGEEFVRFLLSRGADPNFIPSHGEYAALETVIDMASRRSMDAIAHALLEAGADPNLITSNGWPLLHHAVWDDMTGIVRDLIAHESDVNLASKLGTTALMVACRRGHISLVRLLLSHGADPNAAASYEATPLSEAIGNGHSEIELILLSAGAIPLPDDVVESLREIASIRAGNITAENTDVTERDDKGRTLLHLAAADGNIDLIRRLLDLGAEVEARDKRGETPLSYAIEAGSSPVVNLLLEAGADSLAIDYYGRSSLYYSLEQQWPEESDYAPALADQLAIVRMLLEAGFLELYQKDLQWESMLEYAIYRGCAGFMRLLFEYGLDPNAVHRGSSLALAAIGRDKYDVFLAIMEAGGDIRWNTPDEYDIAFLKAAYSKSSDFIRYFLEHDPELRNMPDVITKALQCAVGRGHIETARLLLGAGADIHPMDHSTRWYRYVNWPAIPVHSGDPVMLRFLLGAGASPGASLYAAARMGDIEIVHWMFDYGVDVNATLPTGETALMGAIVDAKSLDTVELLLSRGADLHRVSDRGLTALKAAVKHPALVRRLLDLGADPDAGFGETALMLAVRYGSEETIKMLLDAGADVNAVTVDGDTVLRIAQYLKQDDVTQLLLKRGAREPEISRTNLRAAILWNRPEDAQRLIREGVDIVTSDIHGDSPLRMAIAVGSDLRVIEALLQAGADANEKLVLRPDDRPYDARREGTPLIKAVVTGRANLVRLLLAFGADPNLSYGAKPHLSYDGYRALPDAVLNLPDPTHETRPERLETVRLLLAAGASPNVHDGGEGLTPLQEAARRGDIETMALLIDYGADLEMPCDTDNDTERTALHYAVDFLQETAAQYLIERGANVNALNRSKQTPLVHACETHFILGGEFANEYHLPAPDITNDEADEIKLRLAALLIQHGADVNNQGGATPLNTACDAQTFTDARCKLIRLLLDAGAKIDTGNERGHIPTRIEDRYPQQVLDIFAEYQDR